MPVGQENGQIRGYTLSLSHAAVVNRTVNTSDLWFIFTGKYSSYNTCIAGNLNIKNAYKKSLENEK